MTEIPTLLRTQELDFGFIEAQLKGDALPEAILYDGDVDSFMILFVPTETKTVVHYRDDGEVALLFTPRGMRVVGFQIEAFRTSFIPRHPESALARVMKAKLDCVADSGDLVVLHQAPKPKQAERYAALSREAYEEFRGHGMHGHPVPV